jgi:hypothetical protein
MDFDQGVPDRVINGDETKIKHVKILIDPGIMNPYWVCNDEDQKIGTACLELRDGGFEVELMLDHHTPERLDFEVLPESLDIKLMMQFAPGLGLVGYVRVSRR